MQEAKRRWFRCAALAVCLLGALLTGCSHDPNVKKQKFLESGERYYDKGQYQEAAIQFQNAIQVDSEFAEAHYKLGQTALKLDQTPVALQEFQKAIQDNPDHNEARLEMARLLINLEGFADAKAHLDVLTQKQPKNPDVFLAWALYYHAGPKDMAAAMGALQTALQLDSRRSDTYLDLGVLQLEGQQWTQAEESLKKAVELDPKSIDALLALGKFYQMRGRYPEAEQVFRRAIQNVPGDPEPRRRLASLFLAENKADQAESFLRQSKKDFPDNSVGYRLLGEFYFHGVNDLDKALAEYASLYQEHGRDPVVKATYIDLLIRKGRVDDARMLNDEVLKAQPSDLHAQIYKAELDIRGGKAANVVDMLQGILKNDPNNADAHLQLGLAFERLGNLGRAESEWRDAVRLAPDMVDAHRALAGSAIQRSDWSFLAQEADQIVELQPGDPQGYLLRAIADTNRRQFASGDENIKRSIDRESNNPSAYVQLGNLRMAQNQPAEAQKAYQQALDQDPNSTDAMGGVLNAELAQKQPDKAMATIKSQVARYPNNSEFHTMLGDMLEAQTKDLGGAEAEYQRAAEIDKHNVAALLNLGLLQSQRGALDLALQTYLDGARSNPKEARFYELAGSSYEAKQDWKQARQMYESVLAFQADDPLASNNLASLLLDHGGNVDEAFARAQTAHRKVPENANYTDTLGWAFYQKHVYTSAIGMFKEAADKEKDNVLFNYHLGLAYARNGVVTLTLAQKQLDLLERIKVKPPDTDASKQKMVDDLKQELAQLRAQR